MRPANGVVKGLNICNQQISDLRKGDVNYRIAKFIYQCQLGDDNYRRAELVMAISMTIKKLKIKKINRMSIYVYKAVDV